MKRFYSTMVLGAMLGLGISSLVHINANASQLDVATSSDANLASLQLNALNSANLVHVSNEEDLFYILGAGYDANVILDDDIELTKSNTYALVGGEVSINGNGHKIYSNGINLGSQNELFNIENGATLNLSDLTIVTSNINNGLSGLDIFLVKGKFTANNVNMIVSGSNNQIAVRQFSRVENDVYKVGDVMLENVVIDGYSTGIQGQGNIDKIISIKNVTFKNIKSDENILVDRVNNLNNNIITNYEGFRYIDLINGKGVALYIPNGSTPVKMDNIKFENTSVAMYFKGAYDTGVSSLYKDINISNADIGIYVNEGTFNIQNVNISNSKIALYMGEWRKKSTLNISNGNISNSDVGAYVYGNMLDIDFKLSSSNISNNKIGIIYDVMSAYPQIDNTQVHNNTIYNYYAVSDNFANLAEPNNRDANQLVQKLSFNIFDSNGTETKKIAYAVVEKADEKEIEVYSDKYNKVKEVRIDGTKLSEDKIQITYDSNKNMFVNKIKLPFDTSHNIGLIYEYTRGNTNINNNTKPNNNSSGTNSSSGGSSSGGSSGGGGSSSGGGSGRGSSGGGGGSSSRGGSIKVTNEKTNTTSNVIQSVATTSTVTNGTWVSENGKWKLKNQDNNFISNAWANLLGKWYVLDKSGYMLTGFVKVNNVDYYFNANGDMAIGWINNNGKWYFLNNTGAMSKGWILYNNSWYFLKDDGSMAVNETVADGYKVDSNGVWVK